MLSAFTVKRVWPRWWYFPVFTLHEYTGLDILAFPRAQWGCFNSYCDHWCSLFPLTEACKLRCWCSSVFPVSKQGQRYFFEHNELPSIPTVITQYHRCSVVCPWWWRYSVKCVYTRTDMFSLPRTHWVSFKHDCDHITAAMLCVFALMMTPRSLL